MSDKLTKFQYNEQYITFDFNDGNKMVNATEMAKPFKKMVADFLRLKNTKEYIEILKVERYGNSHIGQKREVLRVVKGGDAGDGLQGTWMDEKLALKFASWLSPRFELWVYDRIEELLKTGKTELETRPAQSIIKSIRLIADQLEAHDKDIQSLKQDVGEIKEYVSDLEAKITSIDENYYSISGWCALHSIPCPLDKAQRWGKLATGRSSSRKIAVGKAYDAKYGEINTYHKSVLQAVITV